MRVDRSPVARTGAEQGASTRVVVAMSGGVDSSVAAAMLVDQGYEVLGIMMRLWSEPSHGGQGIANRCCSPAQMADARRVAEILGIPFYVVDVKEYFRKAVVQFFIDQHEMGRTPNPCIECNRQIRFDYLLRKARGLGARFLATGHYARTKPSPTGLKLYKAVDRDKDQSYVLHVLGQNELSQLLFPLGGLHKREVRELAQKWQLPVASKDESMDLCFVADGDHHRFLDTYRRSREEPGPIIDSNGLEVGRHDGLSRYTIGQRKGIGVAMGQPMYVIRKDYSSNSLVIGTRSQLGISRLRVRDVNWISGSPPKANSEVSVKIRYRATDVGAQIERTAGDAVFLDFDQPVYGATAGQGAVFYHGDLCLGGGIIADTICP